MMVPEYLPFLIGEMFKDLEGALIIELLDQIYYYSPLIIV